MNNNLICVSGKTGTGKSMCLRSLRDQPRWLYLNCENNKALPFPNDFETYNITDPLQVYDAFAYMDENPEKYDGIIIDTATYLMDLFETTYIATSSDSRSAWGDYAQFWKRLMSVCVANTDKKVAILAHTSDVYNESEQVNETLIKVKGSLMNQGLESYFSHVISTKKMSVTKLASLNQDSDLLKPNSREEARGIVHCFQTDITKDTLNERIRSPLGMWEDNEIYISNDLQAVFDRVEKYYAK